VTLYHVVGHIAYVYDVEADTPEYAARVVEEGDGGQGEVVDVWIDRVVLPGHEGAFDPLADEVRKP
jgi:hypothetical protein